MGSSHVEMPAVKQRNSAKVPFAAPAAMKRAWVNVARVQRGLGMGQAGEDLPALPHHFPPPHPEQKAAVLGAELHAWNCFRPKGRYELSNEGRLAQYLLVTAFPAYIIFIRLFRVESVTRRGEKKQLCV